MAGEELVCPEPIAEALDNVKRSRVEYIDLLFTSITGRTHVLTVPAESIEDIAEHGIGFDGSSVGFVGVEESDLFLKPVTETFSVLPWAEKPTGVMIAHVCREDKPYWLDPRFILRKVIARAKELLGQEVEYMTAPEIEFWLFQKTDDDVRFHDDASYFYPPPADRGYEIRKEIASMLKKLGIHAVKLHHEVPPAKHEIDFEYSNAVKTADNTILYRYTVRNIAARHGLIASFMPKPFYGTYGAGMHTHQSLYDASRDVNLFHGEEIYGLSKTALYFIGGLLRYAKAITVVTNPTVNSYKRLVPGWEAPVYITWARYNRSALIRIPMAATPKQKRLEYRAPDGSVNPYLSFAAMLAAGLKGIEEKIEPPEPIEENVYHMSEEERKRRGIEVLPSSLKEAIDEAKRTSLLAEAWGDEAFNRYVSIKEREWFEFSVMVHEWERKRYLELW